jgi:hypothetical protein
MLHSDISQTSHLLLLQFGAHSFVPLPHAAQGAELHIQMRLRGRGQGYLLFTGAWGVSLGDVANDVSSGHIWVSIPVIEGVDALESDVFFTTFFATSSQKRLVKVVWYSWELGLMGNW